IYEEKIYMKKITLKHNRVRKAASQDHEYLLSLMVDKNPKIYLRLYSKIKKYSKYYKNLTNNFDLIDKFLLESKESALNTLKGKILIATIEKQMKTLIISYKDFQKFVTFCKFFSFIKYNEECMDCFDKLFFSVNCRIDCALNNLNKFHKNISKIIINESELKNLTENIFYKLFEIEKLFPYTLIGETIPLIQPRDKNLACTLIENILTDLLKSFNYFIENLYHLHRAVHADMSAFEFLLNKKFHFFNIKLFINIIIKLKHAIQVIILHGRSSFNIDKLLSILIENFNSEIYSQKYPNIFALLYYILNYLLLEHVFIKCSEVSISSVENFNNTLEGFKIIKKLIIDECQDRYMVDIKILNVTYNLCPNDETILEFLISNQANKLYKQKLDINRSDINKSKHNRIPYVKDNVKQLFILQNIFQQSACQFIKTVNDCFMQKDKISIIFENIPLLNHLVQQFTDSYLIYNILKLNFSDYGSLKNTMKNLQEKITSINLNNFTSEIKNLVMINVDKLKKDYDEIFHESKLILIDFENSPCKKNLNMNNLLNKLGENTVLISVLIDKNKKMTKTVKNILSLIDKNFLILDKIKFEDIYTVLLNMNEKFITEVAGNILLMKNIYSNHTENIKFADLFPRKNTNDCSFQGASSTSTNVSEYAFSKSFYIPDKLSFKFENLLQLFKCYKMFMKNTKLKSQSPKLVKEYIFIIRNNLNDIKSKLDGFIKFNSDLQIHNFNKCCLDILLEWVRNTTNEQLEQTETKLNQYQNFNANILSRNLFETKDFITRTIIFIGILNNKNTMSNLKIELLLASLNNKITDCNGHLKFIETINVNFINDSFSKELDYCDSLFQKCRTFYKALFSINIKLNKYKVNLTYFQKLIQVLDKELTEQEIYASYFDEESDNALISAVETKNTSFLNNLEKFSNKLFDVLALKFKIDCFMNNTKIRLITDIIHSYTTRINNLNKNISSYLKKRIQNYINKSGEDLFTFAPDDFIDTFFKNDSESKLISPEWATEILIKFYLSIKQRENLFNKKNEANVIKNNPSFSFKYQLFLTKKKLKQEQKIKYYENKLLVKMLLKKLKIFTQVVISSVNILHDYELLTQKKCYEVYLKQISLQFIHILHHNPRIKPKKASVYERKLYQYINLILESIQILPHNEPLCLKNKKIESIKSNFKFLLDPLKYENKYKNMLNTTINTSFLPQNIGVDCKNFIKNQTQSLIIFQTIYEKYEIALDLSIQNHEPKNLINLSNVKNSVDDLIIKSLRLFTDNSEIKFFYDSYHEMHTKILELIKSKFSDVTYLNQIKIMYFEIKLFEKSLTSIASILSESRNPYEISLSVKFNTLLTRTSKVIDFWDPFIIILESMAIEIRVYKNCLKEIKDYCLNDNLENSTRCRITIFLYKNKFVSIVDTLLIHAKFISSFSLSSSIELMKDIFHTFTVISRCLSRVQEVFDTQKSNKLLKGSLTNLESKLKLLNYEIDKKVEEISNLQDIHDENYYVSFFETINMFSYELSDDILSSMFRKKIVGKHLYVNMCMEIENTLEGLKSFRVKVKDFNKKFIEHFHKESPLESNYFIFEGIKQSYDQTRSASEFNSIDHTITV
ncbi:hypothetical protein HZS_4644, partial [Henneguya salminicola]